MTGLNHGEDQTDDEHERIVPFELVEQRRHLDHGAEPHGRRRGFGVGSAVGSVVVRSPERIEQSLERVGRVGVVHEHGELLALVHGLGTGSDTKTLWIYDERTGHRLVTKESHTTPMIQGVVPDAAELIKILENQFRIPVKA